MVEKPEVTRVVYNKTKGSVEMYAIDANHAVNTFPEEWSYSPWDGSEGVNLPNGEPRAVVPSGWVDLPASERIQLARKLGGEKIVSGAKADDFINEYLVARANAGVVEEKSVPAEPAAAGAQV